MKPQDRFEDIVKQDLDVRASDRTYDRLRDMVLDAHGRSQTDASAKTLNITGAAAREPYLSPMAYRLPFVVFQ